MKLQNVIKKKAKMIRRQGSPDTEEERVSERERESSRKGVLEMVQDGNYAVEAVDLGREEHERLERGR